jgi:hypothetical protein
MQLGDLVVVYCQSRGTTDTWSIGVTGGQSWTSETHYYATSAVSCRTFWCTFDGTWDADPRFDCSATNGTSAIMHVFRPDSTSKTWAVDVAQDADQIASPSSPFTVTRIGLTTGHTDTVTIASWHTADDNTWGSLSGSGWTLTGSAQYRNTHSSDSSATFAHHLNASSGATVPDVSKNQATLGGDAAAVTIMSWYASGGAAADPFVAQVTGPAPRAAIRPAGLLTHIETGPGPTLLGLDTFFGPAGQGPAYDWPNPRAAQRGQGYGVSLNLPLNVVSVGTVEIGAVEWLAQEEAEGETPPERARDWPNPRAAKRAGELRSHVDPMQLPLLGKDKFFGAAGQAPRYDWPNPRLVPRANDLRTHLNRSITEAPVGTVEIGAVEWLAQEEAEGEAPPAGKAWLWPNPTKRRLTPGHIDTFDLARHGADKFFGATAPRYDWPNPRIPKRGEGRSQGLNLTLNNLEAITASGAAVVPSATASGTAEREITSTGAANSPRLEGAGVAERSLVSTGATTVPHATGAGTSNKAMDATGAGVVPHATADGAAERSIVTSGAGIVPHATAAGAAARDVTSTVATTAPHATAAATAEREINASGATTVPHATGAGTSNKAMATTGAATVPHATASGVAEREITATGATASPHAVGAGTAERAIVATGATASPHATAAGAATVGGTISIPVDKGTNAGTTSAAVSVTGLTSGHRLYAFIGSRRSAMPVKPTISDTQSLTWTEVADFPYDPGSSERIRGTIYSAVTNGVDTTITASGDGATNRTCLQVVSYSGAGSPSSNFATGGSETGDPGATISAPASNSGVIAFGWFVLNNAAATPSGWTELVDFNVSGTNVCRLVICYGDSADTSIAWSTANDHSLAMVLEIPASVSGFISSGATTIPHATASGVAEREIVATGATSAPKASGTGTALRSMATTGAGVVPHASADGSAERVIAASGAASVPHATGAGIAVRAIAATGVATVPHATATGQATISQILATGTIVVPSMSGEGVANVKSAIVLKVKVIPGSRTVIADFGSSGSASVSGSRTVRAR